MPNVGTASLDLEVDAQRLGSNIRRAVNSQSSGITSSFRGLGRMGGDALSAGFSGAIHAIERVGLAVGGAGVALGGFGLKVAGDFQQTRIAFEGILGSAEKAQDFLAGLRDFAAKTPFEFPELATASKSLLAVGFSANDVIPIMTKLGNVAATLGVGGEAINGVVRALGQMKGKGKASAEELNQISEQIPGFSAVKAIAEKMGVSTAEAFKKMEAGAVSADFAVEAILEGMERFPGAAGAMERQSKTLNGVISTLKDTFRDALIDGIEPYLPAISEGLVKAQPLIKGAVTGIVGALKVGVDAVKGFVLGIRTGFTENENQGGIVGFFERVGIAAHGLVVQFKEAWPQIKQTVSDAGDRIAEISGRIVEAFGLVVGWVRANWPEIKSVITETMTTIGSVIGGVVDVVQTIWRNFGDQIMAMVSAAWTFISTAIKTALDGIQGFVKIFTGIIHGDWGQVWDGIKQVLSAAWDFIVARVELGLSLIKGAISIGMEIVKSTFSAAWDGIKGIVAGAFGWILDKMLGFAETLVGLAAKAFSWVPGLGPKLNEAKEWVAGFRDDVNSYIDGIRGEITITADTSQFWAELGAARSAAQRGVAVETQNSEGETSAGPQRFALGLDVGPVKGPPGAAVPIIAHTGEFVVTPEQLEDLSSGRSGGSSVGGGPTASEIAAAIVAAFAAHPPRSYVVSSDVAKGLHQARRP